MSEHQNVMCELVNELLVENQVNINDIHGWCSSNILMDTTNEEIIKTVKSPKNVKEQENTINSYNSC